MAISDVDAAGCSCGFFFPASFVLLDATFLAGAGFESDFLTGFFAGFFIGEDISSAAFKMNKKSAMIDKNKGKCNIISDYQECSSVNW